MIRSAGRAVLLVALLALPSVGCGKSNESSVDASPTGPRLDATSGGGGSGGIGSPGAGGAAMGSPDANPATTAPTDCRGILVCVFACGQDAACASRCASTAPADARTLYDKIRACSVKSCPTQDISCRCDNECYGGGDCTDLVDECDMSNPDKFCDPAGTICGI